MATVPMQDPKMAVKELQRVKEQYGVCAVEIGT
jgi:predicted TIM-barrel fold metal-dependent hydrolase